MAMMIPSQSYCFSGIVTLNFLFLVSLVLHTLASPMLHFCRHDQRDALLEFKHEFSVNESNSNPFLSSWNKSSDCCFWEGVKCDAESGEVISLNLKYISLNNSLKPNSGLFMLQHLRNLNLIGCDLYGEIPVSFSNLTKLSYLDISSNQFTGENFPLILLNLTSLSVLSISNNQFKSTLPPDMSRFHNLEDFDVSGNSFSGPFPTSLFMIPSLGYVSLLGNQFKGPIEFSNTSSSSKLYSLSLSKNKFDGPIPKSISKFLNLRYLYLSDNNFTGSIPTSISKLVNLESMDLSLNNFTGSIPTSISKLVNLQLLDLSHNNFVGPIPTSISNLVHLDSLDLSNNKLEGEIPVWSVGLRKLSLSRNSFSGFAKSFEVSDLTKIQQLDLSSNSFRGPLPYFICKLRPFMIDLSSNSFSGSIPQCLKNTVMLDLNVLILRNNNFSGILLPEIFVNATSLVLVDVSGNQLEGKLPKSLINCTYLEILNVKDNKINDKFPSWLSSLPWLNVMILRSNEFYRSLYHPHVSIGFQSLKIIDISHNDFTGTLPPFYFSNWPEMTTLSEKNGGMYMDDLFFREIYHRISMEMVNKGVDTKFELIRKDFIAIDFSGNNFVGEIPKSIGLLKELRLLNLSGNAFTSNIPRSLANLTNLEELDLSRNQISGEIPRDLGSLSFLSTMNFSHNNLEGPIPRGTQFQRQDCSVFMDNPKLYGLQDVCGETHVPNPTPQESENLSEPEEKLISWIAATLACGPGFFWGLVIGHIFSPHKHEWLMAMFRRNKSKVVARSAR